MSAVDELQLRGRRVLVVGLGRSGRAAARLCLDRGALLTLTDTRGLDALSAELGDLTSTCRLELGGHRLASFVSADLIVLSPGVPPLPELDAARAAGVPLYGEVELASRFVPAPIVGVTGTNGKSTTTQLIGDMLEASSVPVFCGGNLGQPLSEAVGQRACEHGVIVLELSSFQLETVVRFRAHVAVLLNLSEDHLDRYPSYEAYQRAKGRLFERQERTDFAVLSAEPSEAPGRALAGASRAARAFFGLEPLEGLGAWFGAGELCVRLPGQAAPERYSRAALRLPGRHNTLNALAALLSARLAGATAEGCARALARFGGLPHRMQLVRERGGVCYYDDSKATNVGAVVGSLAGFERPFVLILGGKDKGGDYAPLLPVVRHGCRQVVLIGAAARRIEDALRGAVPLVHARSLQEAVARAAEAAAPGDAVVLSPACSSFDMFENYEHRGRVFAEAARALPCVP